MKIGPVVLAEKILIKIAWCFHVVVRRISSNISGRIGPNIAIFLLYESALRADDGSVLYFPICQGTLPWQPNNVAEMKQILRAFSGLSCVRYYAGTLSKTHAKIGQRNAQKKKTVLSTLQNDLLHELIDKAVVSFCNRFR